MGRAHNHNYSRVGSSAHGTMICAACNQHITSGQYRAYQKVIGGDWKFVTHHRDCCADDPKWAAMEKAETKHRARGASLYAELTDLIARYPDFDVVEIAEMVVGGEALAA